MNDQVGTADRVFAVTGATGAIGKAIAQQLAENKDYGVVLIARDETKAQRATDEIRQTTGNSNVSYKIADLSRQIEIKQLAESWSMPLHALINNAAVTPPKREETPEGIELQFATNVLGYFWLTRALKDVLFKSAPSRVINVASYWAGDLDLYDLEFQQRRYSNSRAYRQSKQADRMLTVAFAQRWQEKGVSVNACHPGDVRSQLSHNLGFGGHESPDQAAETPVWLATAPTGQDVTGKYFENRQMVTDRFAGDLEAIEDLYQACLSYDKA